MTIRVFIGSEKKQRRAAQTLIHSIQKYAKMDNVDINVMEQGYGADWSDWANHGPTQFTLFRFAIPELCNFEGTAIYLDCDMLLLDDITHLRNYMLHGKWVQAAGTDGDCVSVIDCAACKGLLPSIAEMKNGAMRKWDIRPKLNSIRAENLPSHWNSCDLYVPDLTKLIHFTSIQTQPWFNDSKPHRDPAAVRLWELHHLEAVGE